MASRRLAGPFLLAVALGAAAATADEPKRPPPTAQVAQEVRRAFQAYFARGYVAADFAPTEESGRRRPFYVLRKRQG